MSLWTTCRCGGTLTTHTYKGRVAERYCSACGKAQPRPRKPEPPWYLDVPWLAALAIVALCAAEFARDFWK